MNDPSATLDRLAAHAEQLYSLPAVAMEVLQLTDNPQVDTQALKECIENDPALTGKILRVVNSSLFSLSREISDLNQALALLGTKPLKLLVLGFSLPSGLYAGIEARTLGRYWRRTLTKAVAGRELAEHLWHVPGDDAFIAGLLQDVGILLLLQQLGQPYVQLLERVLAPDWTWTPWRPRPWVSPIRPCRPRCWPAGTCPRTWSRRSRRSASGRTRGLAQSDGPAADSPPCRVDCAAVGRRPDRRLVAAFGAGATIAISRKSNCTRC